MASLDERIDFLKFFLEKRPVSDKLDYALIAKLIEKFSKQEVKTVCDKAAEIAWTQTLNKGKEWPIDTSDFIYAINDTTPEKCFDILVSSSAIYFKQRPLTKREEDLIGANLHNAIKKIMLEGVDSKNANVTIYRKFQESKNPSVRIALLTRAEKIIMENNDIIEVLSSSKFASDRVLAAHAARILISKLDKEDEAYAKMNSALEKLSQDDDELVRKYAKKSGLTNIP